MTPSGKLHHAVNHQAIKALGQQNLAKKAPAHRIISLFKIELENQSLGVLAAKVMDNFVEAKHPIQDVSSLNERDWKGLMTR